eukprot:243730-Prorocentrum_minimum.AAC.3
MMCFTHSDYGGAGKACATPDQLRERCFIDGFRFLISPRSSSRWNRSHLEGARDTGVADVYPMNIESKPSLRRTLLWLDHLVASSCMTA